MQHALDAAAVESSPCLATMHFIWRSKIEDIRNEFEIGVQGSESHVEGAYMSARERAASNSEASLLLRCWNEGSTSSSPTSNALRWQ